MGRALPRIFGPLGEHLGLGQLEIVRDLAAVVGHRLSAGFLVGRDRGADFIEEGFLVLLGQFGQRRLYRGDRLVDHRLVDRSGALLSSQSAQHHDGQRLGADLGVARRLAIGLLEDAESGRELVQLGHGDPSVTDSGGTVGRESRAAGEGEN